MNLCKSNTSTDPSCLHCPVNRSLEVVDWQGAGSALQRTTPEGVFRRWSHRCHTDHLQQTLLFRMTIHREDVPPFLWQVSTRCGCWGSSTRPWSSCWSSSTAPGTAGATASASTSRRRATSLPSTPTAQPVQRSATGSDTRPPVCRGAASRGRRASSNRPHLHFAIQEVCVWHVQLPGLQTPPASPVQAARGRRRRRATQDSQVGGFLFFFFFSVVFFSMFLCLIQ